MAGLSFLSLLLFCFSVEGGHIRYNHHARRQATSLSWGSTPNAPTMTGSAPNCNKWHTVVTGDSCDTVTKAFGITLQQFISWNSAVSADCLTNFWLGEAYCVGVGSGPASTAAPSASTSSSGSSSTTTALATSTPVTTSTATSSINSTYSIRNPVTSYNLSATTVGTAWPPTKTQAGQPTYCNKWHLVGAGDSCTSIQAMYSGQMSLSDFYTWNPAVGSDCAGLYYQWWVCVGIQPQTTPTLNIPTNDTTATVPSYPPYTPSVFPTVNSSFVPMPTQAGIVSGCDGWYQTVANDTCSGLMQTFGYITMDEFVQWNPAVKSDCSGLWANYYYCIAQFNNNPPPPTVTQLPSPTQDGIVSSCTAWYQMTGDDTCDSIPSLFGTFSKPDFVTWNPAVGSDCSGLQENTWYCVAVPGTPTTRTSAIPTTTFASGTAPQPTQTGISSSCTSYWLVGSADTCASISTTNGLNLTDFYNLNPAVGSSSCDHLTAGYYVCVATGTPSSTPASVPATTSEPATTSVPAITTPGSATSSAAAISTPAPTRDGMVSGCRRFYMAQTGDGCWAIANSAGIALDDFYKWNPTVGTDCGGLWLNYYYCIGIAGPTTTISSGPPVPT